MTETQMSIDIEQPAEVVFDYVADMSNNPTWQRGQIQCTWTSDPPIDVGSTYEQHARFLGKDIISTFEVVEFDRPVRIRIVTTAGTMPIDVTREVAALDRSRARVSARVSGDPPRALRLLGPLLRPLMARSVAADYRRLKRVLEDGPTH